MRLAWLGDSFKAHTLRQQNLVVIRGNRERMRISNEFGLVGWEILQDQCREVSIFTEKQQVFEMERVDSVLRVLVNDLIRDEERLVRVRSAQSVDGETTGKTGDRIEERLERFRQVMRDEILVDLEDGSAWIGRCHALAYLHHRDDSLFRVGQFGFTARSDNLLIMYHTDSGVSYIL